MPGTYIKTTKMGVADNKSYKDTYHFKENFYPPTKKEEMPSLNVDANINSTIKKNPYKANVEIEKNEVILQPDLSALFQAKGKRHSQGGIDVCLKPYSFIFSDDKSLSINEKEHEMFELKKMGGVFKKTKSTPAQVLKRNVDLKHYNTLVSNIDNVDKDELSKTSSARMLEKYIGTLGQVAILQEKKKKFPDGVPSFATGVAPVYNDELKNEIMEQHQYKYGGITLPKAQLGIPRAMWAAGNLQRAGKAKSNTTAPSSSQVGTNDNTDGSSGVKPQTAASNPYADPQRITNSGIENIPTEGLNSTTLSSPCPEGMIRRINPTTGQVECTVADIKGDSANWRNIDWEFTPWQKLSQAWNEMKYATAKRYMPYRTQINPSYVDPALVNPEQNVGDIKSGTNSQIRSLNTLNPIMRDAQAQSIYGQFLDKEPQVRSQYDNQNAQIMNQTRGINNQIANQTEQANKQLDQQYYRESIAGRVNFDNMKSFLGDTAMNNVLRDVESNQALAYELATQNNPAWNFDFRSGNFKRNMNKNILDVDSNNKSDEIYAIAGEIKKKDNSIGWKDAIKMATEIAKVRVAGNIRRP